MTLRKPSRPATKRSIREVLKVGRVQKAPRPNKVGGKRPYVRHRKGSRKADRSGAVDNLAYEVTDGEGREVTVKYLPSPDGWRLAGE
jgi:hypothetical protein